MLYGLYKEHGERTFILVYLLFEGRMTARFGRADKWGGPTNTKWHHIYFIPTDVSLMTNI
jgi:hypothetical protein